MSTCSQSFSLSHSWPQTNYPGYSPVPMNLYTFLPRDNSISKVNNASPKPFPLKCFPHTVFRENLELGWSIALVHFQLAPLPLGHYALLLTSQTICMLFPCLSFQPYQSLQFYPLWFWLSVTIQPLLFQVRIIPTAIREPSSVTALPLITPPWSHCYWFSSSQSVPHCFGKWSVL